jgi:hypothetical protein
MADNKGYNGWKNWETWQINLWLDNEEPSYREKVRFVKRGNLSDEQVESWVREQFPNGTPDMDPGDMAKVDWEEIGNHFREEAKEYE